MIQVDDEPASFLSRPIATSIMLYSAPATTSLFCFPHTHVLIFLRMIRFSRQTLCMFALLLLIFSLNVAQVTASKVHHNRKAQSHPHTFRAKGHTGEPKSQGSHTSKNIHPTLEGFHLYSSKDLTYLHLPKECQNALERPIHCNRFVQTWQTAGYRRSLHNKNLTDSICDPECGASIQEYYSQVSDACVGQQIHGAVPTLHAGRMWSGFNETCLRSDDGGGYCNGNKKRQAAIIISRNVS